MTDFGRLITAMITPFDENLEVDYIKSIKLAKRLEIEGNTALVITGTTGEAPTLNKDEKFNLYKTIKENTHIPIIAGVGTNSTLATIENAKEAKRAGVDGLLVVVPYYNKPDQDSLYMHFKEVAKNTDLPIMLYNVPGRTGCNLMPETVEKLAKIKNIVALKEANSDLVQLSETMKRVPEDFKVYSGDDVMLLPAMSVGAYGIVSVCSHVVGREIGAMINAFVEGDVRGAKDIHLNLLNIFRKLFVITNPIPLKAALKILGEDAGGVRLPLTEARPYVIDQVREELKNLGLI